jgi:hypothetical protein
MLMRGSHFRARAEQLREEYRDRTAEKLAREASEKQAAAQAAVQKELSRRVALEKTRAQEAQAEQERNIARTALLGQCIEMGEDLAATLLEMGINPALKAEIPREFADIGTRILSRLNPFREYLVGGYWRLTELPDDYIGPSPRMVAAIPPHPHWDGGGQPSYELRQEGRSAGFSIYGGTGLLHSGKLIHYTQQVGCEFPARISAIDRPPVSQPEEFEELCVNLLEKEIVRTSQA